MGKYVYCVTDLVGKKNIGVMGIKGSDTYIVACKDISAAVSDVPFEELDPTDENLLAHEKVNQSILFDYGRNVVPMAFCTIVGSEEDVAVMLREGYHTFKKTLALLKNKLELGVKVFCDIEKLRSEHGKDIYNVSREIAEHIFEKINAVASDSRLNDLIIDNMIMNASFLLEREKLELFNQTIKEVDDRHGSKLLIRITGPMAAYSFVDMPGESSTPV